MVFSRVPLVAILHSWDFERSRSFTLGFENFRAPQSLSRNCKRLMPAEPRHATKHIDRRATIFEPWVLPTLREFVDGV